MGGVLCCIVYLSYVYSIFILYLEYVEGRERVGDELGGEILYFGLFCGLIFFL